MNEVTYGSRLRGLALALLNATLLLAVLLVFGLWLLLGRAQHFAADTAAAAATTVGTALRDRAEAQIGGLGATLDQVRGLEGRIDSTLTKVAAADSAAATELAGLRGDLQRLTAAIDGVRTGLEGLRTGAAPSLRAALRQLLLDIAGRIGPLPATE